MKFRLPPMRKVVLRLRHPLAVRGWLRWGGVIALALLVGAWIAVLAVPNTGAPNLITHYTSTFGIDALGSWWELLRLPFVGTVVVCVNLILAWLLTPSDAPTPSSASVILIVASFILAVIVFVGTVLLARVNGWSL